MDPATENLLRTLLDREDVPEDLRARVRERLDAYRPDDQPSSALESDSGPIPRALVRALDALPHQFYVKDPKGRFVLANRAVLSGIGVPPERVIGRTDRDFLPPDQAEVCALQEAHVLITGEPLIEHEYSFVNAEGDVRWFASSKVALRDADGRIVGLVGLERDVTDRRRIADALAASEERLRSLMDHCPVGIAVASLDHAIEYVNRGFTELLGYTLDDLPTIAEWFRKALPDRDPEEALPAWVRESEALSEAKPDVREGVVRTASGAPRHIEMHTVPFAGKILTIFVDLTSRRLAESERAQRIAQTHERQRLESLRVLAGGVAHDFNNLLTSVLGWSEMALETLAAGRPERECVERALDSAAHAASLASLMLDYSGGRPFRHESLDVARVISAAVQAVEHLTPHGSDIELVLPREPLTVYGSASMIHQALAAILANAQDAVAANAGSIRVSAGAATVSLADLARLQPPDHRLKPGDLSFVEVLDTGCGMSEETLTRAFEPVFSTRTSGRGLGLAAAIGIMRQHDGAIHVHSVPDEGTCVRLWFPGCPA